MNIVSNASRKIQTVNFKGKAPAQSLVDRRKGVGHQEILPIEGGVIIVSIMSLVNAH